MLDMLQQKQAQPRPATTGEGEDKYLIATSEQTLCAMHRKGWFEKQELPIRCVLKLQLGLSVRSVLHDGRCHAACAATASCES